MKKIIGIFVVTLLIATTYSVAGGICKQTVPEEKDFNIESDQKSGKIPTPTPFITVNTDRFVYHIGKPIRITFKNNGQGTVSIGGSPIYKIERFSFSSFQWQFMYPSWIHPILIFVDPAKRLDDTWYQLTSNQLQVPMGFYKVTVQYFNLATNTQDYAFDYFVIVP